MHVSCATKRLLESGDVELKIHSEEIYKEKLNFFDKRAIKRVVDKQLVKEVETNLEVVTLKHINNKEK